MTTKAPKYTIGLVRSMVDQSLLRAVAMQEARELFVPGSPVRAEIYAALRALQRLQKLLIIEKFKEKHLD